MSFFLIVRPINQRDAQSSEAILLETASPAMAEAGPHLRARGPWMRTFRNVTLFLFALSFGLSLAGAADPPSAFKVSELSFVRPEAWEWVAVPSGGMRKAQLKVPNTRGEAGEVVFFHFGPGNGGGTKANVERWFGQFQGNRDAINAKTEEEKVGDNRVTFVSAEGTYRSGMPGGPQTPKPDFALQGAIIEDPAGFVFVRLTGPKTLVEASRADFKKMIASAKH